MLHRKAVKVDANTRASNRSAVGSSESTLFLLESIKPWQNGSNESFNGKFRDEWLGMRWFKSRIDAKILIDEFRRQFKEGRPHSRLGQLTLAEFKQRLSTVSLAPASS